MRITIGGVLLVAGIGTAAALGTLHKGLSTALMKDYLERGKAMLGFSTASDIEKPVEVAPVGAHPSAPSPVEAPTPTSIPTPNTSSEVPVTTAVPLSDTTPASNLGETKSSLEKPAVPAKTAAVVIPAAPAKPAAPRAYRKRYRRPRRAVPAPPAARVAARTPAKPAAAKRANDDPEPGTYVTLKLKSGSEVQGVFLERNATGIRIELPGTGPFDYPFARVVSMMVAH